MRKRRRFGGRKSREHVKIEERKDKLPFLKWFPTIDENWISVYTSISTMNDHGRWKWRRESRAEVVETLS
jgi:hypothetical protein